MDNNNQPGVMDITNPVNPPETQQLPLPPKKKKKKRTKKQKIKLIIIWTILALLVAAAAFGIYQMLKEPEKVIPTTNVMRGTLETVVRGSGTAMPKEKDDVVTLASGKVTDVFVKNGDKVEVGAPLYKVDTTDIDSELNEAYASLDRTGDDLSKAYKKVSNLSVSAPFKGKTLDVTIKKGDQVSEGSTIATMVDDSKMKLVLYFSYAYIDAIKVGMASTVSIPQSMATVEATVTKIERIKRIMPEGTILFEVEVTMDNPGILTKDMVATAALYSDEGEIMPAQVGKLAYNDEMSVTAKSSGEVVEIIAKNYYEFSSGDTLCVLENDSLGLDINRITKEMESQQKIIDDLMEKREGYEAIAQIAGTVLSCNLTVGEELTGGSGKVAVSIANLTDMVVDIQIDELDVGKMQAGMPAEITVDDMDGTKNFSGEVISVSLEGKAENGVSFFPGQIRIIDAQGIMTGMYVNYRVVAMQKGDCLLIPSTAAVYTDQGMVAFVRKGDLYENQVELDPSIVPEGFVGVLIETGASNDQNIEVISGLTEGMEIASMDNQQDNMGGNMRGGKMGSGVIMRY